MRKTLAPLGLIVVLNTPLYAAGPSEVASIDLGLWPDGFHSPQVFDRASRAEQLAFGHALDESEQLSDDTLRDRLKLNRLDRKALDHARVIYWHRLLASYRLASASCTLNDAFCTKVTNEVEFRQAATDFQAPANSSYLAWYRADQDFQRTYLNELLRLASLFPQISSEVDTYSPRELSGNELADRHFLLTFDDGPTRVGGNTDKLLALLRLRHVNATFFLLGELLQSRLQEAPLNELVSSYEGMCAGGHGWEHRPHSSWSKWQGSVVRSMALVRDTLPNSYVPLFRPPYGERRADSGPFFDRKGLRVALWNIDSQDWNAKVDADQVKQRVLTLMLLWRHGVILFHDTQAKAQVVVPWLLDQGDNTVQWIDCHAFPPS